MKQGCLNPEEHREHWEVQCLHHNHSAFNGYRLTPSDYSRVLCPKCGRAWRTKANYVSDLPFSSDYLEFHS